MDVQVNILAVLLAAVSSLVVGAVWYSLSVFGKPWGKLVGLSEAQMKQANPPALGIATVMAFITAYVLAHVTYLANQFFDNSYLHDALTTTFWVWLGFVAARIATQDAFARQPGTLTLINLGNEFVTFMLMGLIIGLIGL